ncbi:MAG: SNF2 helicase associated domain-containing protein [Calditrichia bacterium]|nr:SNF2 helicase associated domain-containing protein [Calditrichia bacterium]
MVWKDKIGQLAALLEKIPHPQSFEGKKGIYQPYFVLELRPVNWEIVPFTEYTRLDGAAGKDSRLNYQVIESQKVNINQDELNLLSYLLSFNHYDSRRLFAFGQPVGFLLDWLRGSPLKIRNQNPRELKSLEFQDETGNVALGIFKDNSDYLLQPIIVYPDRTIFLEGQIDVLTANPTYLLNNHILYRVDSTMPASFWINFFRLQQTIRIPLEEIKDFINSFVSKILPALDWKSLEEHLKVSELPLTQSKIRVSERAGQFSLDVKFQYQNLEFPAQPPAQKSLASQDNHLFIVKRDYEQEADLRNLFHDHGILYIQHRWQIDPKYSVLDWMRAEMPKLKKKGIEILGEDKLRRFRFLQGQPKLKLTIKSRKDWFTLNYALVLKGENLQLTHFTEILKTSKEYLKLPSGVNIYLGEELNQRLSRFLELIGQDSSHGSERFLTAAFPLVESLENLADDVSTDAAYKKWKHQYQNFSNIEPIKQLNGFEGTLRDYQKIGVDWLSFLNQFGFGGILADDMGLGKTIQVIALLSHLKRSQKLEKPVLIVVPLTVLFNWKNELQRFAPPLKVLTYQGQKPDREQLYNSFQEFDVILISYGILLQDRNKLSAIRWEYAILDESQKIKNPLTKTYQAVSKLRAFHRLCLTGTPIENSPQDLWAQFNFLNPGIFGTLKQFEARFTSNGDSRKDAHDLLRKIIHPFILRRRKEEVLEELPERTNIIQYIEMTPEQSQIYRQWLEYYGNQIFEQVDTNGIQKSRIKILEALTYLRQLACHPAIFQNTVDLRESGKMVLLEEMLEELIEEGHKVLIFSQFVRFLKLTRQLLDEKKWAYEYMDGSTRKREQVIRNFQTNPNISIFLISLKTGGLGLNLTAADYVIHLDPWWNPAVEQQASDRAHRIGQTNRVFVYKYIVKDSVEEKILQLQQDKIALSENLITSEKSMLKQLKLEDLKQIFQILQ